MSKIEVNTVAPQCGTTLTLGESGDTVTLGAGASQSGFGRTGTVDWQTGSIKTSTFTAVSGEGYFCNTTSGAFTCNLPAGSAGAIVSLADYAGTWQTNSLTVSPNGSEKIGSANVDVVLSTEGQSVTLVYVDSTQGWINTMDSTSNVRGNPNIVATGGTVTESGDYKIHTFTGPGTFQVTNLSATPAENVVSYMVVAGGGAGGTGSWAGGGGGGAGGFREYKGPADSYTASPLNGNPGGTAVTLTTTSYPITVGGGGTGATACSTGIAGAAGSNSIFSTITSIGGGGGIGGDGGSNPSVITANGGSGGGASSNMGANSPFHPNVGQGNTPPVSPPQGNNGGDVPGSFPQAPNYPAGGGGGAGAVGGTQPNFTSAGGSGGVGVQTNIDTNNYYWAAGGGGNAYNGTPGGPGGTGGGGGAGASPGPGGIGSGGTGGGTAINSGTPGGTPNTYSGGSGGTNSGGGGGGSGGPYPSIQGSGGSGIVIIRYKFQ